MNCKKETQKGKKKQLLMSQMISVQQKSRDASTRNCKIIKSWTTAVACVSACSVFVLLHSLRCCWYMHGGSGDVEVRRRGREGEREGELLFWTTSSKTRLEADDMQSIPREDIAHNRDGNHDPNLEINVQIGKTKRQMLPEVPRDA